MLIAALNANIDYVKIHAMAKDGKNEPSEDDDGSQDGGEVTPVQPE